MTGWLKKLLARAVGDNQSAVEPLVLTRKICDHLAEKIQVLPRGRKLFPYNLIVVQFFAADVEQRAALRASFEERNELQRQVHERLLREEVTDGANVRVKVEIVTGPPPEWAETGFRIDYRTEDPKSERPLAATLTILQGVATQSGYALKLKNKVGRNEEVVDKHGRLVQRNDIVFTDCDNDANLSVSRIQSRIDFDVSQNAYLLYDDNSTQGTFIERDGRMLTVAGRRGVALQNGDVIYFGSARAKFALDANTEDV